MTEFKVGDRVIHAHGRRMGLVERVEDDGASVRWDGNVSRRAGSNP